MQARFGSGTGGIVLMMIPLITTFNSGVLSLTTNARCVLPFPLVAHCPGCAAAVTHVR